MKPFERIVWHAGEPPAVLQGAPVPLKIGIHEDLAKLARSPATEVRKALRHYCSLKPYIAALLVDQAMRHNVDGEPVEPVSEAAQAIAASLMRYRLDATKKPAPPANETTGVLAPKPALPENVERLAAAQRPNADLPKLTRRSSLSTRAV